MYLIILYNVDYDDRKEETGMCNQDIRKLLKEKNIKMWQLADQLGISEPTITRWFRRELPQEKKKHIIKVIKGMEG